MTGPRLLARAFRHELITAIRGSLAGAEQLHVSLAPVRPSDLVQGTFRDLRITGQGFTTEEGLRYDRIDFTSKLIQVDPAGLLWRRDLSWRKFGPTHLRVQMGEAALTDWLRLKMKSNKPKVVLDDGMLRIEGRVHLLWADFNFSADGVLRRKTATSLIYYPQALKLGGLTLTEQWFKDKLEKTLGGWEIPLEMPFPLELTDFQIKDHALFAEWREPKGSITNP